MSLTLMYITNNPSVAKIVQKVGVDRIWIDMEWMGKEERQSGMHTVKSSHTLDDITILRKIVTSSQLMVRVNPFFEGSKNEIDESIKRGADVIMLPMWRTIDEVKRFIDIVDGRATTNLLLETAEAKDILPEVVNIGGIDEIHIGLNDLHLCYNKTFMFELLADGTVEDLVNILKTNNIKYGFGGIGRIGDGLLPASHILAEHVRLGSNMVILSRVFCNTTKDFCLKQVEVDMTQGVFELKNSEEVYKSKTRSELLNIHEEVKKEVQLIVNQIKQI